MSCGDTKAGSCGGGCGCASKGGAGEALNLTGGTGVDAARRFFLKSASAFTTLALAPGVTLMAFAESTPASARPADQPVSSKNRWGLLIDAGKCSDGCNDCVTACSTENGWKSPVKHPATDAQWIR